MKRIGRVVSLALLALACLACATTAQAQALDGSCHANASSGATLTCSLTTTLSPDIIGCSATTNGTVAGGPNVSGVSSTNTTGWAARGKGVSSPTTTSTVETWYGTASGALTAETMTVTFAGTPTFETIDCFGISGANTSTKFDSNGVLPVQAATAPQNMSTSNATDMLIAAARGIGTCTAAAGWTRVGSGANFQCIAYKVVTSTQSALSVGSTTTDASVDATVLDAVLQSGGGLPGCKNGLMLMGAGCVPH